MIIQQIGAVSDTRDRIRFAAMRLFAQKGYGSTSVADILGAAEVNAGSLYYLYPGKQDVLLDVLDTYLAGIHPFVDAGDRLPADTDRHALAVFALTTMEGGVMLSRTHRTLDDFDAAVRMLRSHVEMLMARA